MSGVRQPIGKALAALRWLMEAPAGSGGVREISLALSIPPASGYRALSALVAEGLATQDKVTSRYSLSWETYRLGLGLASHAPWKDMCLPHLRSAARAASETVSFSIFDEGRMQTLTVARVESEHAISIVERNQWKSLHAGASGLAVLAFLDEKLAAEAMHARPLVRVTEKTIVDPSALGQELSCIRQKGYAFTRGQRIPGAVGLAAPVVFPDRRLAGSVHVSIPEQRFPADGEARLAAILLACSEKLARALHGGSGAAAS